MIVEIILSILVLVFGYTTFNLFRKLERMEQVIEQYEEWITNFSDNINAASNRLEEIDNKGTFESDDEVGFFFKYIKDIQDQLNKITKQLTGDN
tara:strand:- start:826 stop:1107 length:282 start_codon:yes stop_codon:yes gene_type:complete